MIHYDVICQHGNAMARIYKTDQISLAIAHAKSVKGDVVDRITKEVIFEFKKWKT